MKSIIRQPIDNKVAELENKELIRRISVTCESKTVNSKGYAYVQIPLPETPEGYRLIAYFIGAIAGDFSASAIATMNHNNYVCFYNPTDTARAWTVTVNFIYSKSENTIL